MKSLYPVAVHLLFVNDGKVLMLKRYNTGYEDGNYSVVAGHVEYGESLRKACVREAREEVNVSIAPQNCKCVGVIHRKSDDERIDFFYRIESWQGTPVNNEPEKCSEVRWFSLDELPGNTIPYIKYAINNVGRELWVDELGWCN